MNEKGLNHILTVLFLLVICVMVTTYFMYRDSNNGAVNASQNISNTLVEQANEVNSTMVITH